MINIKDIMYRKKRIVYYFLIFTSMVFIFIFNIRNITKLIGPSILWDEYGYWVSAAFFAGKDWSILASELSPYYSYGYSFILFPLFKLTSNMPLVYQLAIIQNIFMVLFSFLIINYIISFLFPRNNKIVICLISLVVMFYPSVIHHTQFAWSETLLLFVFLTGLLFLLKIVDTQKTIYFILYAISLIYLYMIHLRTLGIVFMGIVCIIFLYFIRKISLKNLIIFLITFLLFIGLTSLIENLVNSFVWNSVNNTELSDSINANTYVGQVSKIKFLFTKEGMYLFWVGLLGKLYYAIIASLLFGFFSMCAIVRQANKVIIKIIKKVTTNISINEIIYLYIGGSFIISAIVASVFLIYINRIDMIAYGRYTDYIMPIITAIGMMEVFNKKIKKITIWFAILFVSLFQVIFNNAIREFDLYGNFAVCSPITMFFRENDIVDCEPILYVNTMTLFSVLFAMICVFLISRCKQGIMFLGIFLTMVIWIVETKPAISSGITMGYKEDACEISEIISKIELPIYYVPGSDADSWIGGVQMQMRDKTIYIANENEINSLEEGLIIRGIDNFDDSLVRGAIILSTDIYVIEHIDMQG